MSDFFTDIMSALSGDEFDEIPVDLDTFVTSEEYLNQPPLSENQYLMIEAGSQIYREETLIGLYGEERGIRRYSQTYNECIYALGKGSGKDYSSTIVCAYVAYLLLCLKNPQKYFSKPDGDNIDIMNIAVNAQQANRVFFKSFAEKIKKSPWFDGKYDMKQGEMNFDKNINVISGHSESESLEGYNVILVVLDEISGFALESNTGNKKAKTASAIYEMHRASVDSRFPDEGKVLLLSFPRFKGDFISQRYDEVVAEKEVLVKTHTFKIDEDLPDGVEGNEFTIQWEEDHIVRYAEPGVFALKRPTWEINPLRSIGDFKRAFFRNEADALTRFACMPTMSDDDAYFKDHAAIDETFIGWNGVGQNGVFRDDFKPREGVKYFIHVDLAQVHDRCAVAMSHVESWNKVDDGYLGVQILPKVVVDAIRWWQPSKENPMDFNEVIKYILALRQRGFDIQLVTFDRWNSVDTMNTLSRAGVKTDRLSVANQHYDSFMSVMYDRRLVGPKDEALIEELKSLLFIKGKVDHPRSGNNDLSDAVCGSINNAIAHTPQGDVGEVVIDIIDYGDVVSREREQRRQQNEKLYQESGVIVAPKREMPDDVAEFLAGMRMI